jgi:DNA-binding winged helix-turn-helix (wHTH) protein/DNA-binding CsgD family transcriptional regulator
MGLKFAELELDLALFELRRDGARVRLEPQALAVLVYLINHRDRIVSTEELMDQIWGGRFVSEGAVTSRIKQARRAVGDDDQAQRVIKTLHGGYHFVAPVREVAAGKPPDDDMPVRVVAHADIEQTPVQRLASSLADVTAPAPLVGRDSETGLLHRLFEQTRVGRGYTVLLTGEPGIGKSALLVDLTRYAEAGGGLVLTGRATPGAGVYRPFTEALMKPLRAGLITDSAELRPFRAALSRILPGWTAGAAPEPGIDPVLMLGEGVLRLLLSLDRPGYVLALEDLHDADADTLSLIDYLAAAATTLPILIVGTHRDWPRVPELDRLAQAAYADRIQLPRLPAAAVAQLVDTLRPLPPDVRQLVVQRAEGLPLVVGELVTGVGRQPTTSDTWLVPESFAALIEARMTTLNLPERKLLAAASVLGAEPEWDLVPAIAGVGDEAAVEGFKHGIQLQLLAASGDDLRWRHGLVRQAVWAGLLPPERRALARRAADLLLARATDSTDAAAVELLLSIGDSARAAEILLGQARRAIAVGALRSADELIQRAAATGQRRPQVAMLQVQLMTLDGRVEQALEVGASGLEHALADDHAELCLHLARAAITGGRWSQAEDYVERGGRSQQAQSLIVLTDAAHGAGRIEEAARLAAAAVSAARDGEPAEVLCEALCAQARIHRLADPPAAAGAFREAAQVASEHGLRPWRAESLFGLGTIDMLVNEDSVAFVEARELAVQLGLSIKVGQADMLLADHRLVVEGPVGVDDLARGLIETGELLRFGVFKFVGRQLLAAQLALAGEQRAAEDQLRELAVVAHLPPDILGLAESVRAYGALAAHDLDSAVRHLDDGLRPLLSHSSTAPLADFGLWAVASAASRGDKDQVRTALRAKPVLLRRANRGALAYADAIVAGRRKDAESAVQYFAAGSELLAATPWWSRFLRLIVLEMAIADGWGDPVPQLRADLSAYEQERDAPLGRICRELLRRAGAGTRRGRGDSVVPAHLRALGVTSRELDVLRLIEAGLTNAAISEQLFLSPRTIETHVANLLAKSGAANRQALRAWYDNQRQRHA